MKILYSIFSFLMFVSFVTLCVIAVESANGFLDNVTMDNNGVYFSSKCAIADLIHECGHWAVVPSIYRHGLVRGEPVEKIFDYLPEDMDDDAHFKLVNSGEQAVLAWSYAVAFKLDIIDQAFDFSVNSIGNDGDDEPASGNLLTSLKSKCHAGIHELQAAGLCMKKRFPEMKSFIQS